LNGHPAAEPATGHCFRKIFLGAQISPGFVPTKQGQQKVGRFGIIKRHPAYPDEPGSHWFNEEERSEFEALEAAESAPLSGPELTNLRKNLLLLPGQPVAASRLRAGFGYAEPARVQGI
jgi:hypothetical protein